MDKKRIRHMGLAAVLSIAMLGTTVPVTVLAATSTGTVTQSREEQAPSSKEEAEAAKNEAQKRIRTLRRKRMPQRRRRRESSRNTIGCKPS